MTTAQFINAVTDKEFDRAFAALYGKSDEKISAQRQRYTNALESFGRLFGMDRQIAVYTAPGRTELAGNHTDHNKGKVLAGAVNIDAVCIISPNGGFGVNVYSEGYGQAADFDCRYTDKSEDEKGTSQSLVKGVCRALKAKGAVLSGFDAYVFSDVAQGSGLSSSAAFEVVIARAINGEFCGGKYSPVELARAAQFAENEYFGKPSGLMDQLACSVGGVAAIDFADEEKPQVRKLEFDMEEAGLALCVVDTGASHANLTDEYARIKEEMCRVAAVLGKNFLGHSSKECLLENFRQVRKTAGDRAFIRAMHFYDECERVQQRVNAIEVKSTENFLQVIQCSGHSSFEYNQNAYCASDAASQPVSVALAMAQSFLQGKRAAWRLQGGGFAGTIMCFVPKDESGAFSEYMDSYFGRGSCMTLSMRKYGAVKLSKSIV